MIVFEIVIPGTWLDYEDVRWASKIETQLRALESQFFEANAALSLFTDAGRLRPTEDLHDMESQARRFGEIQRAVAAERGSSAQHTPEDWVDSNLEAQVRFKRDGWANGHLPREFEQHQRLIYARAFLYAVDGFEKFLNVLAKEPGVPPEIAEYHGQIAKDFPDLRGVRNTAHHLEDRSRGLGAGRNPLVLKPIVNNFINAPNGGVLVLNCLNGTKYTSTTADGVCGEIDVSEDAMRRLQRTFTVVLQSFQWRGPKRHAPNA